MRTITTVLWRPKETTMSLPKQFSLALSFLVMAAIVPQAGAVVSTVTLNGTTTNGGGAINPGDAVSLTFTFDDATPPSAVNINFAIFPAATLDSFTIGGLSYTANPGPGLGKQEVFESADDRYTASWSVSGPAVAGLDPTGMELSLTGPFTALTGFTTLPTAAELMTLNISRMGTTTFVESLSSGPPEILYIEYVFDEIEIGTAVPEPVTATLIPLAIAPLLMRRRRAA